MFKGKSTQQRYEECLKRGLCEEHIKDINQNDLAALKKEFPRKAFRYIRINILYPLLFKKMPKCPKIKTIMEKTPAFSKILLGENVSDAVDIMIILDSVVVATLCELSKICCIGALFHMKKKINCEDPKLKPLRALLLVDQLDKTIVLYLYKALQKNFTGYDSDIIKASHVITLIFVRNFCNKFTMKTAFENIEKDIVGDTGWEDFKNRADVFYRNKDYTRALDLYTSALLKNFYSSKLYVQVANCNFKLFKFKPTQFYSYLAITVDPTCSEAYLFLTSCLFHGKQFQEALQIASYGLAIAEKSTKHYENLKTIHSKIELLISKSSSDASNEKRACEKPQPMSVKLIDSDSAGSEDELSNAEKPIELINSLDSDNGTSVENVPQLSVQEKTKNKTPAAAKKKKNLSEKPIELTNSHDSDDDTSVENMPQLSVQEKTKNKPPGAAKKKRSLSECSRDSSMEKEMDLPKINSHLKEASEALVDGCGYKAVQIFRGPLRDFIESSKFQSFEECDIVCIKYSHGIAYCKSGGYEDLKKCIVILKDILEKHDSITFPAVHYSLGVAYRKLNRFKESLQCLEIVKNFLEKGIHFKVYSWPGVTAVIQETKPDVLKVLVDELMQECESPPNPDAYCRYEKCYDDQRTIYYTDPDFKGYISLSCSEQCCMQYHLQCWKIMKTEKELIDKDFLEKPCFTPDCDGVIVKIQNIDKKGDLGKEFISNYKKNPKQKWAKWEKKPELKDKKRKRHHSKPEEINNEPETKNGLSSPAENGDVLENILEKFEKVEEINANSQSNGICSSSENSDVVSETVSVENGLDEKSQMQRTQSEFLLNKCIKENVYSFMADFLLRHGPLKVDDPLLIDEMAYFPKETLAIIEYSGGIGEFLKDNLKFAYVGDIYICHVNDVAAAYKMCSNSSLSTDFKTLPSLNGGTKYYSEYSSETACQGFGLNPNALEYTPVKSTGASQDNLCKTKNLSSCISGFRPRALEASSSSVDKNSSTLVNSVSGTEEVHTNKSKSYEEFSTGTYQISESTSSGASTERNEKSFCNNTGSGDCEVEPKCSKSANADFKLTDSHRESINTFIKPYITKQLSDSGTMAEIEQSGHGSVSYTVNIHSESSEDFLKAELKYLSERNGTLNDDLDRAIKKQFELRVKVTQLQQCLEAKELENDKFEKKQQEFLDEKRNLSKSLTDAKATIEKQNKEIASLTNIKHSLQKSIDSLMVSRKTTEDKKIALEVKEKQLESNIKDLQNENAEIKNRAKNAELHLLNLKKTEYLKKIDEKSIEAVRRRKELTDGLSLMSSNLNPVLQNNMKALSAQLLSYVTNLANIRSDFMKQIDKEIELVTNGTPLNEVKELKMKDLPEIPCWTNSFTTNGPTPEKLPFYQNQSPFNLGLGLMMPPQIPPAVYNPLLATSATVISSSQVLPSTTSAVNVSAFSTVVPPSASTIVPPVTAPPLSASSKNSKIDKSTLDFTNLNPQIEESFKSGMASINSFASAPYPVPSLDDEFQKKCVVFQHPDPVPSSKPDIPKVPPGIQNSVIPSTSNKTALTNQQSESTAKSVDSYHSNSFEQDPSKLKSGINLFIAQLDKQVDNAYLKKEFSKFGKILVADVAKDENGESKGYGFVDFSSAKEGLAAMKEMNGKMILGRSIRIEPANNQREGSQDSVQKLKMDPSRSNSELEKKKAASGSKNSYEKLLSKLKEHFPECNNDELISFVKEFRAQRHGKLSGMPMDKIICEISNIIQIKKRNDRKKLSQTKCSKVLVNKKLVPDSKPPAATVEPQSEKKTAWCTVESRSKRRFSGNIEDDCPICCDPMTTSSAYKVACGHAFHEDCIRKWLNTKSDCPVCRVLLLLPEEYPCLS